MSVLRSVVAPVTVTRVRSERRLSFHGPNCWALLCSALCPAPACRPPNPAVLRPESRLPQGLTARSPRAAPCLSRLSLARQPGAWRGARVVEAGPEASRQGWATSKARGAEAWLGERALGWGTPGVTRGGVHNPPGEVTRCRGVAMGTGFIGRLTDTEVCGPRPGRWRLLFLALYMGLGCALGCPAHPRHPCFRVKTPRLVECVARTQVTHTHGVQGGARAKRPRLTLTGDT